MVVYQHAEMEYVERGKLDLPQVHRSYRACNQLLDGVLERCQLSLCHIEVRLLFFHFRNRA